MTVKKMWNQFLDKYMKRPEDKVDSMVFLEDEIRRYDIIFSGVVQGVGFRYETWTLAQKLGLVGYVENLPDETVHAEIQGPENKIFHLIECLKSIPRIYIEKMKIQEITIKEKTDFEIAN